MFGEENLENTDETLEVKVTDRRSQSSDEDSLEFDKEESVPAEKPGDPEELRERLEKLEARHQDVLNRLTRSQADLANVKRRAEMKASDVAQYANQAMAFEVLRVLDGFERAFASLPADLRSLTWIDGVALIQAQLRGALEAWGVTVIRTEIGDDVDIEVHEVVVTDGDEADSVLEVVQQGYRMHDRVLRPVLVKAGPKVVDESESQREVMGQDAGVDLGEGT
tara:strand:+ start:26363 stop:27031 length:669 start_codon:yes stop_codon:yes gene_type:complete